MSTSTTTGAPTRLVRRFVDPEDLICPGCGNQAVGARRCTGRYSTACRSRRSHTPTGPRCAAPRPAGSSSRLR